MVSAPPAGTGLRFSVPEAEVLVVGSRHRVVPQKVCWGLEEL